MTYLDLFAKNHGSYYVGRSHLVNKGLWYWYSFRTKVPHYHVPERENSEAVHILEGFPSRFSYLLMSVDEIGLQYYFPDDVDIMIPYHFNYFFSLATGIFDNLAIETRHKYDIKFESDYIPGRTSLSKGGKDFLLEVKRKNPKLSRHIANYGQFRKLIHNLRERAVHKEGFRSMGYLERKRFTYLLVIDQDIKNLIRYCGDKSYLQDRLSSWGVFDNSFFIFLEPYRFVKAAALKLINFVISTLNLWIFRTSWSHYLKLTHLEMN